MNKLYRVEISYGIYVLADNDQQAERIATTCLRRNLSECGEPDIICTPIKSLSSVVPEWRDSIPFGDDTQDLTIAQIIKSGEVVKEV
jgi:hypothetical protein